MTTLIRICFSSKSLIANNSLSLVKVKGPPWKEPAVANL